MTDKDVGELWRYWDHFEDGDRIAALIRKLVDERAALILTDELALKGKLYQTKQAAKEKALDSFGIDPASWEK